MLLAFFKKGATTTLQTGFNWQSRSAPDLRSAIFPRFHLHLTFGFALPPKQRPCPLSYISNQNFYMIWELNHKLVCILQEGESSHNPGGCPVLLHEWNSQVTFHLLLFFNYIKNTHLCVSCCLGDCEGGWCLTLSSDPSKHHQISASLHSISTRMQTKHFIMVTLELRVSLF